MKKSLLLLSLFFAFCTANAQDVSIDGRLKPYLDDFFALCKEYNIDYHENLFKLKKIAIVEDLQTGPEGSILGMVQRDASGQVENIVVNWVAMLDQEILKVVAFHEFGHYFLGYDIHVCDDCGIIMSKVNSSYFDIAQDWEHQLRILFVNSPAYQNRNNSLITTTGVVYPQQ